MLKNGKGLSTVGGEGFEPMTFSLEGLTISRKFQNLDSVTP
jgi:hypothetical protein